jgi:hypothetical protein
MPRLLLLAAALLFAASCSSAEDESFEDQVRTYLKTESRYRHTLDWRGEIEDVRCGEPMIRPDFTHSGNRSPWTLCEIQFAKIDVEPWSVSPLEPGTFFMVPHGNESTGFIRN